jgi:AcrR family transcriptional regulator
MADPAWTKRSDRSGNRMPELFREAPRPRERILAAARDLFHKHGIRGVGVETIAEAAGSNKMTLYRHFESKDDLIVAYLRGVAAEADAAWREIESENPTDKRAQLKSWLIRAGQYIAADGRGCDLANAAVELTENNHPARHLIERLKTEQRDRLVALCRDAGIVDPEILADALFLLFEGARVSRQAAGTNGPSAKFIATAEAIVESFRRKRGPVRKTGKRRR